MSTTSSSPAPMILDAGYAWRSQELDIVMLEAVPARRRISSEGYQVGRHLWHRPLLTSQTPPQCSSRPLKRPHSPTLSPRPSSPAPGSKKVKPLPRPATFSPKRRCTESERPSTPAPTPASKPKSIPAKPLLHRLAQTVTPQTSHEPVGLELEKVFAIGVGQGLVRRSREGSRLGRVAEAEREEEMEWE